MPSWRSSICLPEAMTSLTPSGSTFLVVSEVALLVSALTVVAFFPDTLCPSCNPGFATNINRVDEGFCNSLTAKSTHRFLLSGRGLSECFEPTPNQPALVDSPHHVEGQDQPGKNSPLLIWVHLLAPFGSEVCEWAAFSDLPRPPKT